MGFLSPGELIKQIAQTTARLAALKKFTAGIALAALLALPAVADPNAQTTTVLDPAGDVVFPYDLYGAPVPPYLDITLASVTLTHGVFHFEIKMGAEIRAMADPGFTPSVNHLGATFGLLTDPAAAKSKIHFFGQTDNYNFNFYVGALYSVADSGLGLGLGWHAFLIDLRTFTTVEIPLQIRKDTLILETSAASLGNPTSFAWLVASECDPVPINQEDRKSIFMVDWAPDHGYASWPTE
jgi:hypothetical protein